MESIIHTISLSEAYTIRPMDPDDVSSVVWIHIKSFSGFFLSFLGPAFLKELYRSTLLDHSGIGFVAENGDQICGFITGTTQPSGFYKRLIINHWWKFVLASIIPVFKRPSIIPRLIRALSMPSKAKKQDLCGTLMSIAVLPEVEGKGIGKTLVHAFLIESANRGIQQVNLHTDCYSNDAVNMFYKRIGFRCEREYFTSEGRGMKEYVIDV